MKNAKREKSQSNWGKFSSVSFKIGDDFKMMQSQVISHFSFKKKIFLLSSLNFLENIPSNLITKAQKS